MRHRRGLLTAVLSLGLALGLSGGLVALVNGVFYPPSGVPEPSSVSWVRAEVGSPGETGQTRTGLTFAEFVALHETRAALAAMLVGTRDLLTPSGEHRSRATVAYVSGDFFKTLRAEATIGRLPEASDLAGEVDGAVLSYDAWVRLYGKSPSAVGSIVEVQGRSFTIVGVAAAEFSGPIRLSAPALWLSLAAWDPRRDVLDATFTRVLARLSTEQQKEQFVTAATSILKSRRTLVGERMLVRAERLNMDARDARPATVMPALTLLISVLVLLAAANMTGFLWTVAFGRQREIGLRIAIGATRGRLVFQLLVESFAVAIISGVVALLSLQGFLHILVWALNVPVGTRVVVDGGSLGSLAATVILAAVLGGLAPLRFAQGSSVCANANGDETRFHTLSGPRRLRAVVLLLQVALSVVALAVGSSSIRATMRARSIDLGFDTERLVVLSGQAVGDQWTEGAAAAYFATAAERLQHMPVVANTALVSHVFGGGFDHVGIRVGSRVYETDLRNASSSYFDTIGVKLVAGRAFSDSEAAAGEHLAVVSALVANRAFGGARQAIGKTLGQLNKRLADYSVVGVVPDSVMTSLTELAAPLGAIYLPMTRGRSSAFMVIRVNGEASRAGVVIEGNLPAYSATNPVHVSRLASLLDDQVAVLALPFKLAAIATVVLLILTLTGLEALLSLIVSQRRREIAVRMMLGASRHNVVSYVLGRVLMPTLAGAIIGVVGGVVAVRQMTPVLAGVRAFDPTSITACIALLLLTSFLGVIGPIVWATRLQPASVLRMSVQ